MAMAVARDSSFALTVSADHLVGRYNFAVSSLSTMAERDASIGGVPYGDMGLLRCYSTGRRATGDARSRMHRLQDEAPGQRVGSNQGRRAGVRHRRMGREVSTLLSSLRPSHLAPRTPIRTVI